MSITSKNIPKVIFLVTIVNLIFCFEHPHKRQNIYLLEFKTALKFSMDIISAFIAYIINC